MKAGIARFVLSSLLLPTLLSWADFKYTQTTKISGGAMAGIVKFAGSVSGKENRPSVSTKFIKGNRMRVEEGDGSAQIFDLEGRRIISVNPAHKTYAILTFDEMQAQIQAMQERLKAAQKDNRTQFNLSPKVQVTPTQNTRSILGETTREVQVRLDMEVQAGSDKPSGTKGTMAFENDLWVAPSVRGYDEVKEFYRRLAEDLNWAPGGGAAADPRVAKAMAETLKNSEALEGMPLVEVLRLEPSGNAQNSGQGGQENSRSEPSANSNETLTKGLGGLFGGLGKKKKDSSADSGKSDSSLMTTTVEVTSFSSSALDSNLFEIPAGYTQVQSNPNDVLGGRRSR